MNRIVYVAAVTLSLALIGCNSTARPGSPAATAAKKPNTENLAGEWRFALDSKDAGINEAWFNKDLTDKIKLPGILQAQGYGDDITKDTPWVTTPRLGPQWWMTQPESVRAPYSQPGNIKVPFLAQPPKHYLGAAWYQRDIDIPAWWQGKRVALMLERPRWESMVWVDDKQLGSAKSLVAPHDFDLGMLSPGKHRLSIRLDNRMIVKDYRPDGHSVSDSLGATWNGIAGRIELSATSPVAIDDAQVFPNVAKMSALIKVKVVNDSGQPGSGVLTAGSASAPIKWDEKGGSAEIEVPMPGAKLWDEFQPNLQHLTINLTGNSANDRRDVTFGMREIKAVGKMFVLNGKEINVRMTHSGGDFPLTGYPPTDVASWKKIIQVCKDYGLNGFRFHSWCPPEAAFTAADELGFYIQPECGMWNGFSPGSPSAIMLPIETALMMKNYGNHPSYILLSASNETSGSWQPVLYPWAKEWYQTDPRRLYCTNTGRSSAGGGGLGGGPGGPARGRGPVAATAPGAATAPAVAGRGPRGAGAAPSGGSPTDAQYAITGYRGPQGWFGRDYSAQTANIVIPALGHEVGQWCAYPDYDVMKKFTGYLQPTNYEIFRDWAQQHGVLEKDHEFAFNSGKFQVLCYKEEIEANLRTAGSAGIQILDLHDYIGQGTALVGVVDTFWESKGYVTGEEFRRFCNTTVPLARLYKNVLTTADKFDIDVEIAHYGPEPLNNARPVWKIVDQSGKAVAQGQWDAMTIPIGRNIPLGKVSADLSKLAAPQTYKLVVGLQGTKVENDWNFWLYPAQVSDAVPTDVLLTSNWADATAKLAAGGKVLFTPPATSLDNTSPPLNNVPVFWNRQMTPKLEAMMGLLVDAKHPALAEFPTQTWCDWQWAPIVRNVKAINVEKAPKQLEPIVWAIDDWNRNFKLGVIFEGTVGSGKLLVSAIDLQTDNPGVRQLRRSLLDYMATAKFQPQVAFSTDQANALWPGSRGNNAAPITFPSTPDVVEPANIPAGGARQNRGG